MMKPSHSNNGAINFLGSLVLAAALSTFGSTVSAGTTNETMTKMVVRTSAPDVPPDSFAAKPKTIWRVGRKYGRIEEVPDPILGIHGLLICNEPDAWMINLVDKSGKHIVD